MSGRSRKSPAILALEFEPSAIRFVEMQPEGHPENQVVAAGVVPIHAHDSEGLVNAIRSVLSQTYGFQSGSATSRTLIASVPLRHAFVRAIDVPEKDSAEDQVRWEMAQYLARPLDLYAFDFQGRGDARTLAAAYRLSEIETLRATLAQAGAPAPSAIDVDVLPILGVFAHNYPECLPERTLILKADVGGTTWFRTHHGEYLGGLVQRESTEIPLSAREPAAEPHERAEQLLGRVLSITKDFEEALGPWQGQQDGVERVFLCGDLAGDADFRELLKTRLRVSFALLNPFRVIPGPSPDAYAVAYPGAPFAVGVGLALRASGSAATGTAGKATQIPHLNLLSGLAPLGATAAATAAHPEKRVKRPTSQEGEVEGTMEDSAPRLDPEARTTRGTLRRALVALTLLIVLAVAGILLSRPHALLDRLPASPAPVANADSLLRALDREASELVALQQFAALAWLSELETSILADSAGVHLTRTVYTTPTADSTAGTFALQGVADNLESLSRFQEFLVLIPNLTLDRSVSMAATPAASMAAGSRSRSAVEFLFTGTLDFGNTTDSVTHRVLATGTTGEALTRFLTAATTAGFSFDTLPAPAGTVSGTHLATPFRLTAACATTDSRCVPPLHALLENERQYGSPFAIQRILLSSNRDSQAVFLDIMAFSR